ncbi:UPF0481 protein At3g47200-like [Quercus lobata]|uniref:Uncharacterized protein n=1 Tax=Quercus lobata TaxID=97700 RepID=A0A7N2LDW7_QUELO|nr:UPF0481 protein At3g47200-like [Quercus lobata]XP_030965587.1 UPF0481 protein At3g47200-like [Quercus lobata]
MAEQRGNSNNFPGMEIQITPSEQRGGKEYSIEIPPPAQQVEPEKRRECCIYKVPLKLRRVNEDAYTPKLISIGPYHHKRKNLKKMEDLKRRYFWDACDRTNKSPEDLSGRIQKLDYQKILHCYADDSHMMKKEDFMTMILLDSIFIIEELWRTNENPPMSPPAMTTISQKCEWRMWGACVINFQKERKEDNPEKKNHEKENPWRSYNIMQDLLLLENQVPFFVLEDLYEFAYSDLFMYPQNEDNSFRRHVHEYLFHFWEISGFVRDSDYEKIFASKKKEVKHFTDFLRYFLLPHNPACGRSFERVPCATKLSEAGVEFKASKSENGRLLDIQFRKSALLEICPFLDFSWLLSCFPCLKCLEIMQPVLELKSFIIGDETESVVRNLMALEQCHYPREAYVCNYIVLLDHLINTAADVDLLVEKNVIVNWLGNNKAVATLINGLCLQIIEGNHSCYFELSEKIKDHYNSRWSKLMASLTNLYFKDFWRGTATVVGIMVLLFAFWNFLRPFVFHT